jgi:hypothetical protein
VFLKQYSLSALFGVTSSLLVNLLPLPASRATSEAWRLLLKAQDKVSAAIEELSRAYSGAATELPEDDVTGTFSNLSCFIKQSAKLDAEGACPSSLGHCNLDLGGINVDAGNAEGDMKNQSAVGHPDSVLLRNRSHQNQTNGQANSNKMSVNPVMASAVESTRTELMACAEAHLKEADNALTEARKLVDLMSWEAMPLKVLWYVYISIDTCMYKYTHTHLWNVFMNECVYT